MPIICLITKKCSCGKGMITRTINIKSFKKEFFSITESTLRIWNDKKCCWRCKKKPEIGEKWGISINHDEKNRIYCSGCAEYIEDKLKESV